MTVNCDLRLRQTIRALRLIVAGLRGSAAEACGEALADAELAVRRATQSLSAAAFERELDAIAISLEQHRDEALLAELERLARAIVEVLPLPSLVRAEHPGYKSYRWPRSS